MGKPLFLIDMINSEYELSFSMSPLKLALLTCVWSCFLSNQIRYFRCFKVVFAANGALCRWKIAYITPARSHCEDPVSRVKIFQITPLHFTSHLKKCSSSDIRISLRSYDDVSGLILSFMHTIIPVLFSLTIRFFLFNSNGALIFTDCLAAFLSVAQIIPSAYCSSIGKPLFLVLTIFLNITL